MSYRYLSKSSEDMNELEDNSVDLIITTPPEWDIDYACEPIIPTKMVNECYRVLKKEHLFFYNIGIRTFPTEATATRNLHLIRNFYDALSAIRILKIQPLFYPVGNIVIIYQDKVKVEPREYVRKRVLAARHEHYLMFSKGDTELNLPGVFADSMLGKTTKFKSDENIVAQLMDKFSKEGDLILDPMAGTGTVGIVAHRMKRDAIMYDVEGYLYAEGVKRSIPNVTTS